MRIIIIVDPLPGLVICQSLDSLPHPPGVSCVAEVSLDFLCMGALESADLAEQRAVISPALKAASRAVSSECISVVI